MKIDHWLVGVRLAAAMLGILGSSAVQAQMGGQTHMGGQAPMGAPQAPRGSDMNPGMAPEVMQPMTLTDEQVKNFLDTTDELRAKNKEAKAAGAAPGAGQVAQGGLLSAESLAIIQKHGFKDATEFQRVAYNVGMARSVLQQGGKEAVKQRLDKAQQEQGKALDKMRGQLSPEQLKTLEAQGADAMQRARAMESIPEENLKIVEKYQDRMQANKKK